MKQEEGNEVEGSTGDGARGFGAVIDLAGGGLAWFLHLALSYLAAEFGCLTRLGEVRFAGMTGVVWMLLAIALFAAAGAGLALRSSWRRWRGESIEGEGEGTCFTSGDAWRFTARTGIVINGFFLLVIVVGSAPILYYLRDC